MRRTVTIITIILCLLVGWVRIGSAEPNLSKIETVIMKWEGQPLTEEALACVLIELEMEYPKVVFRQAMLETGHLRSKLCRTHNNLFGMRKPRKRMTFAIGETRGRYAKFKDWVYSVADYKLWQGDVQVDSYYTFLKRRNYASNPHYVSLLKAIVIDTSITSIFTQQGSC